MTKTKSVVITAIVCLTILELYALSQGINGQLFTLTLAAIAGAVGYVIQAPK